MDSPLVVIFENRVVELNVHTFLSQETCTNLNCIENWIIRVGCGGGAEKFKLKCIARYVCRIARQTSHLCIIFYNQYDFVGSRSEDGIRTYLTSPSVKSEEKIMHNWELLFNWRVSELISQGTRMGTLVLLLTYHVQKKFSYDQLM